MTEATQNTAPSCVLPHENVQLFLLDLIDKSSFNGSMSEFVTGVKEVIRTAQIGKDKAEGF